MNEFADVNRHYLDRVMDASKNSEVEATEDIVAGNGMKLLSKGARIDERVRERLLEYKLRKPLESSLKVAGGPDPALLVRCGERLLEEHSTLQALRTSRSLAALDCLRAFPAIETLHTLLALYGGSDPRKLDHAVAVSLLAISLHQQLGLESESALKVAALSGLFHDVGELYIDPAVFRAGGDMPLDQWKQVCVHPLVAHRLLSAVSQLDKAVAMAVLQHHERLDGFGYPMGLQDAAVTKPGCILAASELLAGLSEASRTPLHSARVALKLVPREFDRSIVDVVSSSRVAIEQELDRIELPTWHDTLEEVHRVVSGLHSVEHCRPEYTTRLDRVQGPVRVTFLAAGMRYERIRMALASAGVNTRDAGELRRLISDGPAPGLHLELTLVLREIRWRLRELGRELMLRVQRQAPDHLDLADFAVRSFSTPH
ncbi:HD domain-containing protein [Aquabacterium sp. A7-Y]|uniref:HD-GYP domain-containing protein n=1 Tax=Aquabacterium sp. A7-Y TaxID=1349605 RepID=UPI00223E6D0E|nr:HD domain-containing phosphohydrolase [Aquabacterium sp. A7-Y]MCW7538360.1 HD domain-containing protein [Aquabacterium sp. A7-Y]